MTFLTALLFLISFAVPAHAADVSPLCLVTSNLSVGVTSTDVQTLQYFLKDRGTFTGNPTGYFGPITGQALGKFQLDNGIIANIQDGGTYGPKTKSFIQTKWCGGVSSAIVSAPLPRVTHTCGTISVPECSGGALSMEYDAYGCLAHWKCTTKSVSKAPQIQSFKGPTQLEPGKQGAWIVSAIDPQGGSLSYTIDWGDGASNSFGQGELMTHTYTSAGSYQVAITAQNNAGSTARTTTGLQVGAAVALGGVSLQTVSTQLTAAIPDTSRPLSVLFTGEALASVYAGPMGATVSAADQGTRYIDFGDLTTPVAIGCSWPAGPTCMAKSTHTYTQPGTYTATLFSAGFYGTHNDATYGTRSDVTSIVVPVGQATSYCQQDTMRCSDGSYVGRVGVNCTFAACPVTSAGGKCATPWGGAVASDKSIMPYEPYFTGGAMTYTNTTRMQCLSGTWAQCGSTGTNCIY